MSKNFPNILEYDEDKGLYFHTLGKGVKIYRGDSNFNLENNTENELNRVNNKMLSKKDNVFFGLSEDDINNYNYGRPFEFEVIKEGGIKLLRIDGEQTIGRIYQDATGNDEIQRIIVINYGYSPDGIKFRLSKKVEDDKFSRYLCNKYPEYDGYISERREQELDALNAEMSICNPIGKVRLTGKARGIKDDDLYTLDLKARQTKEADEEARYDAKKRKQEELSKKRRGENLFNKEEQEEDEEEEDKMEVDSSDKKPRVNTVLNFGFSTPTTTPENGGKKKKNKKTKKNNKNKKKHTRKKKGKKN